MSGPESSSQPGGVAAVVRPRALFGGAALPVERVIEPLLAGRPGTIFLFGQMGGGKSTAIAYLRDKLSSRRDIEFLDEPQNDKLREPGKFHVVATSDPSPGKSLARLMLAPWSDDDMMDYLVAAHRDRCASVLTRLRADASRAALEGLPELCRIVLDEMADDDSLGTASAALRKHLAGQMGLGPACAHLSAKCFSAIRDGGVIEPAALPPDLPERIKRLVRHRPVQTLLAADYVVDCCCDSPFAIDLSRQLPPRLILEVARLLPYRASALEHLGGLLASERTDSDATVATILLAADPDWMPTFHRPAYLGGAHLFRAHWPKVNLSFSELMHADFSNANLTHAVLDLARAGVVKMNGATLIGASLKSIRAYEAIFVAADLTDVTARDGYFSAADFSRARLVRGDFTSAILRQCILRGAQAAHAIFRKADLSGCEFEEADFSDADLSEAQIENADLSRAIWKGARFRRANLLCCNLEGLDMTGADFDSACLKGSYLTGSRMPGGNFHWADLRDTGLADVEWPNADLRGADLRGCSFHLGSTRSGLVGSVIPCEGSRTGFYTDDYNDQDYKPPEEIRKANLCGADLRGANIEGVDFYLVDLRGAKYSREQERHLARCGAILRSRVA